MKNLLFLVFSFFYISGFSQDTTMLEKAIFDRINTHRTKIGRVKYVYNGSMVASCRKHSRYMGKTDNLVHVRSLDEVKASGEIIQMTYITDMTNSEIANEVLQNFLNSPPHKGMIESYHTKCSVGVFIKSDDSLWITIRFY